MASVVGTTTDAGTAGVYGESSNLSNDAGPGVHGVSRGTGVVGDSKTWHGVAGISQSTTGGVGVWGKNVNGGTGVIGESEKWMGVYGKSGSTSGGAGVMGEAVGPGVIGKSQTWMGVYGETTSTTGGAGVWGEHKAGGAGVVGVSSTGTGVFGKGKLAGRFEGDVEVTGDIRMTNADCAEEFEVGNAVGVEPGMVMILEPGGRVRPSDGAYDRRVVGVVSGAGDFKPAIVLDKQESGNRWPIALMGKVFCNVDAEYGPIEVGDLLTTSPTAGHAMKVADATRAFGTVLGKALQAWPRGRGSIAILTTLQ